MLSESTQSIDVVIPTFGNWEVTERCLQHLRAQTVAHTVTIADNGSTDGTAGNVRSLFPEAKVIELNANLGFAAACNQGAAAGTGEIIVLLNNDVEARPDFLENLVRPFNDVGVGSASPLLVQPDEQTIDCVGVTADRTLAGFSRLRGRPVAEAASPSPLIVGPLGGGGAYRRAAWEEVAGLDEGVLFYGEDTDLAIRLRSAGWKAVTVPEAVAIHLGSVTAGHRSSWQRFQSGFGRGYFVRRYRLVSTGAGPRTLATDALIVTADAIINRDLSALRGRLAGWRAARGLAPRSVPPSDVIDASIGFRESLRLRRVTYTSQQSSPASEALARASDP